MISMITIRVSDFTTLPGPRFIEEGPFSGQLFRNEHLGPAFQEAVHHGEPLEVDLDGMTYGYPASFLEESFGGLARIWTVVDAEKRLTEEQVWKFLKLSSKNPILIETVHRYVLEANKMGPTRR